VGLRFALKWDLYCGLTFNQVHGGLGFGFLQHSNIDPTVFRCLMTEATIMSCPKALSATPARFRNVVQFNEGFGNSAINVWVQQVDCELFRGLAGADCTIGRSHAPHGA
jgi:hypothetical protein